MFLVLKTVTKRFADLTAVAGVDLQIAEGEFVSFLGPSGCGKTTLLRLIAGLEIPDSGQIELHGRDLSALPARKRNFGVVFQSYSLFPNLTVANNVAYGLQCRKAPRALIAERVNEVLALVHLAQHAAKYPHELSGGMQQRVAIARALAYNPAVLLMDEPFAALDALTREEMQRFLVDVWKETKKTVIYVTHNVAEAVYLADRVIVFSPHPGTLRAQIKIELSRPRDTLSVEFLEYQKEIVNHIVERK